MDRFKYNLKYHSNHINRESFNHNLSSLIQNYQKRELEVKQSFQDVKAKVSLQDQLNKRCIRA